MDRPENGTDKRDILLAEAMRRAENPDTARREEERIRLVVFSVGRALYGFDGRRVSEILRYESPMVVPGAADIILGIINVRGNIDSVLDLHGILDTPETGATSRSRIILIHGDEVRSGVRVDSVEDVTDIPADAVRPLPDNIGGTVREIASGLATINGKTVTLLDAAALLKRASA